MINAIIAAAIGAIIAYLANLPLTLGAHPFWAVKVLVVGAPVGLVLALLTMRITHIPRLILMALLCITAFAIAHYGKTEFAASYAENAFAGKLWFFGWIATCAFAIATVASLPLKRR